MFPYYVAIVRISPLILAFAVLSSCAAPGAVQDNPSAHQKIVFASAYSVEGCRTEMNHLAGSTVRMINDSQQPATSIFSLGIIPAHECIGIAKDTAGAPATPAEHE
jgi:hypothetical protein